jgi:hypothetical protein
LGGSGRVHNDDEVFVAGCYLLEVVPFQGASGAVSYVDCFLERVVACTEVIY